MSSVLSDIKKDYMISLLKSGKREDGRSLDDMRNFKIEIGLIDKAEGSCFVQMGETKVIAGVKCEIGEPFPDTPNQGVFTTNAELIPMASPDFEAGPPREDSIELARIVDRGIRESGAVDFENLVIKEGELVRVLFVDLHILDYNGNLFDACGIAAIAALYNTKMPALDDEGKKIEGKFVPLPMKKIPVPCTYAKIADSILYDPSFEEESVMDSRITVTTEDSGRISAMQKGDVGSFKKEEILDIVRRSKAKGEEIRSLLKEKFSEMR
jgi:exosome complex component RRP42